MNKLFMCKFPPDAASQTTRVLLQPHNHHETVNLLGKANRVQTTTTTTVSAQGTQGTQSQAQSATAHKLKTAVCATACQETLSEHSSPSSVIMQMMRATTDSLQHRNHIVEYFGHIRRTLIQQQHPTGGSGLVGNHSTSSLSHELRLAIDEFEHRCVQELKEKSSICLKNLHSEMHQFESELRLIELGAMRKYEIFETSKFNHSTSEAMTIPENHSNKFKPTKLKKPNMKNKHHLIGEDEEDGDSFRTDTEWTKQSSVSSSSKKKNEEEDLYTSSILIPLLLDDDDEDPFGLARELITLCAFDGLDAAVKEGNTDHKINNQKHPRNLFALKYRASRDGFGVEKFYEKLADVSNTLTLIKSTNHHVFGGYTRVPWYRNHNHSRKQNNKSEDEAYSESDSDSNSNSEEVDDALGQHYVHKRDPQAFLFSLVNAEGVKVKMECLDPSRAIRTHPHAFEFGCGDLTVSTHSNTSISPDKVKKSVSLSRSQLGQVYKHPRHASGSVESNSFLAGTETYLTSEIEVYEVLY